MKKYVVPTLFFIALQGYPLPGITFPLLNLQIFKGATPAQELPIIPVPTAISNDLPLVFFISGDGGWTSFDNSLSQSLAKTGMPVIGLDAQKYFWKEKTPDQTAAAISKTLESYLRQWHRETFVLMGFSFGASIVPFVAERMGPAMKEKLRGLISLSPDENADFEIHLTDMLNLGKNTGDYQVLTEIIKNKPMNPICIFGEKEESDLVQKLRKNGINTTVVPGGHHYNNDYKILTRILLDYVQTQSR